MKIKILRRSVIKVYTKFYDAVIEEAVTLLPGEILNCGDVIIDQVTEDKVFLN